MYLEVKKVDALGENYFLCPSHVKWNGTTTPRERQKREEKASSGQDNSRYFLQGLRNLHLWL